MHRLNDYQHKMTIPIDKLDVWKKWFAANPEPYGRRCFTYADEWATLMERTLQGDDVTDARIAAVAKKAAHMTDTDGVSGLMQGMAASILVNCWIHGEALRRCLIREDALRRWRVINAQIENGMALIPMFRR